MRILTDDIVSSVLSMERVIAVAGATFAQLAAGVALALPKQRLYADPLQGFSLFMPAYVPGSAATGLKVINYSPQNPARNNLPALQTKVMVFDATSGQLVALLSGAALTALRTAAAAGVATRLMARADARVLAVFGAGRQALSQAIGVSHVRQIERIWIANRTARRADELACQLLAAGPPVPTDVHVATSASEALKEADIVCCATSSFTPLFSDLDLVPGAHINAIGATQPSKREIPAATVARARIVVDSRADAMADAGDLVMAMAEGVLAPSAVVGELGEVVSGTLAGRTSSDQITLFKSVGNAALDVAVAKLAYDEAQRLGLGHEVDV